jgi:hypothetical protein
MAQITGIYRESGTLENVTQPGAAVASVTVKSGAGKAFAIDAINANAAARFLYCFDSLTATGTLLFPPISIPAGGSVSIEWLGQLVFNTGLTLALSTTQTTFAAAGADMMVRVLFK